MADNYSDRLNGSIKAERTLKGKIVSFKPVDDTLTKSGHPADAKVTGDRLDEIMCMLLHNDFSAPLAVDDNSCLADDSGKVIVADWKYKEL